MTSEPDIFKLISHRSRDAYFLYSWSLKKFLHLGPAFETIFHLDSAEIHSDNSKLASVIHPDDREVLEEMYVELPGSEEERRLELRIVRPEGDLRYIRLSLYPIQHQGETLYAGYCEDITATKNNIIFSEIINGRKNSMLEILSHDFKGQLAIISLFAESLKMELSVSGNPAIRGSLDFIKEACQRNIVTIRQLANTELIWAAEQELRRERSDLAWHLRDLVQHYQRSGETMRKTFELNTSAEKIFFYGDTLKLMQIVNNLIANAIKFTPDNALIEIYLEDRPSSIYLFVRDNGVGIPEHLQQGLFQKYTIAGRKGLHGEESGGLGLSIVKAITELHSGKVWVESVENTGTTVHIELPKFDDTIEQKNL